LFQKLFGTNKKLPKKADTDREQQTEEQQKKERITPPQTVIQKKQFFFPSLTDSVLYRVRVSPSRKKFVCCKNYNYATYAYAIWSLGHNNNNHRSNI
jgi:glutamyl/glutaminyl-tRNA synthetase